ncbi:MAG: metallophosphoesterase family protein [Chloroflexi bacterium]|uniref:Metallophosphatase family protein n=1 Tax=Candidatus Chlorohelix allophototropha TaxID=3003348 RepID=A0A8T7LVI3_9CHLR|nr:metallophosphoesterase family protein [Chloroflexota bacterium]WJW66759.1 metallophosphatase family protein [Chloroflexota bacterium L227-S17]
MSEYLKIAIFSDIHANAVALEAVLEDLQKQSDIDYLVAAGDIITDGTLPRETWKMLQEMKCRYVRGNHEDFMIGNFGVSRARLSDEVYQSICHVNTWTAAQLDFDIRAIISEMPMHLRFSPAPGHDLVVVHSNFDDCHRFVPQPYLSDEELQDKRGEAGAEVFVFGHYHENFRFERAGVTYANVASVSAPVDRKPLAAYSLFSWRRNHWEIEQHRVPYDVQRYIQMTLASDMPEKGWQLYSVGHHQMLS